MKRRYVQRILDNMCARLALLENRLPIQVEQIIEHRPISLKDERFYKLGAALTKIVQEASQLEETMEELYARGAQLSND